MSSPWHFEQRGSTLLVVALAACALLGHLPALPRGAAVLLENVRDEGRNRVDQGRMVQGYYQGLVQTEVMEGGGIAGRMADRLVAGKDGPRWAGRFSDSGATRRSEGDYLSYEMIPGVEVTHLGVPVKVNRWGQRDRDYELEKPAGTFRIALVGASNSMGWGVRIEEAYSELVEDRLNREWAGKQYERYEVINFSVPGYSAVEFLFVAEEIALRFNPDLVLLEACAEEIELNLADRVATRFQRGFAIRYDFLEEIIAQAGIVRDDDLFRLKRRLLPMAQPILLGCYRHLGELSHRSKVPIAVALLRLEVSQRIHPLLDWAGGVAEENGMIALKVYAAFEGQSRMDMYLANEKDHHPSAKAHRLLADDLYNQLLSEPRTRRLLLGDADQPNGDL